MKYCTVIFILFLAAGAAAQSTKTPEQQSSPALTVKRVPAQQQPAGTTDDPLLNRIADDLNALQQSPRLTGSPSQPASAGKTTADFKPKPEMPLTPTAQVAVRLSERCLTETSTPTPGSDGRVLYSYGAGLPTVV